MWNTRVTSYVCIQVPPTTLTPSSNPAPPTQNMACLSLFPFPLPLEGFYPVGVTEVLACVPPEACPGAPLSAITEAFAALAEHDRELFIVEFLRLSAVLNTTEVGPCRMHAFRGPPVLCSSDVLTC
jgi:hypothetical protein